MYRCRYIIQLVKLRNFVENSRTCDPYCAEYCFHRFRTHWIPSNMMLTFRTVRQALLYDLKWSICHVIRRLLRKIDYTGNFYGLISGTRLLWEDMWSRYFICPCQRSHQYQSFSQSNLPLTTLKRESLGESRASLGIILGFHAFILVFYFHLVTFWVLGKLPTGRPSRAYPMAYPMAYPVA